jgi:fibronectin-binding autotransporter adhesin
MGTYTGTYSSGITLTSQINNPVTLTSSAVVNTPSGYDGVYGQGGTYNWTIDNSGNINSTLAASYGIVLGSGGSPVTNGVVINEPGGTIAGYVNALVINGPGSVTNASGALITASSNYGLFLQYGSNTVVNYGTIAAGNRGIVEVSGGSAVINRSGATISGLSYGVLMDAVGTVTNAGTIKSTDDNVAVFFNQNTVANQLVVDPGAAFYGEVSGGDGVLELAAGDGSLGSLGTLSATGITNFATLQFDTGAQWNVAIDSADPQLGALAITGFTANDTIDLKGFYITGETFANNALVLTHAAASYVTLNLQGSFSAANFQYSYDGTGGTDITFQTAPENLTLAGTGTVDWNTASNWDLDSVPTALDNVYITNAGSNLVTTSPTGTIYFNSLTVGGTNTLSVSGVVSGNSITDNAVLAFAGIETLDATPMSLAGTLAAQGSGTLTLGSNQVITQSGASATIGGTPPGSGTIVNDGTINTTFDGGTMAIVPLDFDNEGTINVDNEALTIGYDNGSGGRGTWSNTGTIALSGTASLTLDGTVTTAGIGTITGATGVTEAGVIDNTSATLDVGTGSELGTVHLANRAVVSGGTIADPNGDGFTFSNGRFDSVTYVGPLNVANSGGAGESHLEFA